MTTHRDMCYRCHKAQVVCICDRIQVVQVALGSLQNFEGATTYGPMMMGAVIATIPPVLVFILLQKQFMSGFAISRDK